MTHTAAGPRAQRPPELADALEPQAVLVPGPGWRADAHLHDQGPPERHAHRHGGRAVVRRRVGRPEDDPTRPLRAPRRGREGGDCVEEGPAHRRAGPRALELAGAHLAGPAAPEVQVVAVEADADVERTLARV